MGIVGAFFHLINFAAPAVCVGVMMALLGRWVLPGRGNGGRLWLQVVINTLAGVTVLLGGLWYFGRDGKMASYAALVLAIATCQWLSTAWSRR